jgi:hypothetical protein
MRSSSSLRTAFFTFSLCSLALSSGAGRAATEAAPQQPARESAIDPRARDALTRMGERLRSLSVFAIDQNVTREQVINGDLKVQKSSFAHVIVQRPDHFKADVMGDDGKNNTIYFDGKVLTLFMHPQNYYAQMDAPGPSVTALDKAEAQYGVEFPGSDFLRMASGEDFADKLTAAGYVGESRVGDALCDHYAYRTADVDYQLWIQQGSADGPLPRRIVITSKKQPTQPQYTAALSWDISPRVYASYFNFTPPEGATKITFGGPATPRPTR